MHIIPPAVGLRLHAHCNRAGFAGRRKRCDCIADAPITTLLVDIEYRTDHVLHDVFN
jgi:hypothetical protein